MVSFKMFSMLFKSLHMILDSFAEYKGNGSHYKACPTKVVAHGWHAHGHAHSLNLFLQLIVQTTLSPIYHRLSCT